MSDLPPSHLAMVAFGERVRHEREKKRLTIHGLSRELEKRGFAVGVVELSDVEHGRRWLAAKTIAALAAILGVSTEWLRDGPEEEPRTLEQRVADLERRVEALASAARARRRY